MCYVPQVLLISLLHSNVLLNTQKSAFHIYGEAYCLIITPLLNKYIRKYRQEMNNYGSCYILF
jgi:hypothetical protein